MVEPIAMTHIVSTPNMVASMAERGAAAGEVAMPIGPDELLIVGVDHDIAINDPHLIIVEDHGWSGVWLDRATAEQFLSHECHWQLPKERPAFAQGMVSHLAAKLWLEENRVLVLVARPLATELAERLEDWL